MHLVGTGVRRSRRFRLTYNLEKEFPFRPWYTYSVATVFVVLIGLFTVFNVATTGYDLQPETTHDPNGTLAETYWFNNPILTFGDSKLKSSCQTRSLAVGDFFFSSNLGFYYTITSLSTSTNASSPPQRQSAIAYLNNTLENCEVDFIAVTAKKADLSKPGDNAVWWSWATSTATANAHCQIFGSEGMSTVYFQVDYAGVTNNFDYVILEDPKTRASVWWGTRLLGLAFTGIQTLVAQITLGPPTYAVMTYQPNYNTTLSDPSFFNVTYFFLAENGAINNDANSGNGVTYLYNDAANDFSPSLTEGWFFAKIFYSLILVDLGETSKPNLLLDNASLQTALNATDDFNRLPSGPLGSNTLNSTTVDWWKMRAISPPNTISNSDNAVPMNEAFADPAFTSVLGPLGTKNSTISTQYICSVPRRKGIVTIILLVFLGNWVLLESSWMLLKFISTEVIVAKDPDAMVCEGCSRRTAREGVKTVDKDEDEDEEGEEAGPERISSRSSYQPLQGSLPKFVSRNNASRDSDGVSIDSTALHPSDGVELRHLI